MAEQTKIKVYVLRSGTKSEYKFKYKSNLHTLKFSGGGRSPKFRPGRLITSDPMLQEVIENHPQYGAEFYMHQGKTVQANSPKTQEVVVQGVPEPTKVVREFDSSNKGAGRAKAEEEARIIAEAIKDTPVVVPPEMKEVSLKAPEEISTVAAAAEYLRDNYDDVKASSVNTRAGIKEVAEDKGIVFPGMDL